MDVTKAVTDIKGGKITFRVDKHSNLHLIIGKASFTREQLVDNYAAVLDEVLRAKPSAAKGKYLRKVIRHHHDGPGHPDRPERDPQPPRGRRRRLSRHPSGSRQRASGVPAVVCGRLPVVRFDAGLVPVRPEGRLDPARRSTRTVEPGRDGRRCSAATAPASRRCSNSAAGVLRPGPGAVPRPPGGRRLGARALPGRPALHRPRSISPAWPRCAAVPRAAAADAGSSACCLTGYHRHAAGRLSKGTAQKVGLAQALLAAPGLLVLDEPWEGLDSVARDADPEIVAEVTAAGGSVLVSDHRGEIAGLPGADPLARSRDGARSGRRVCRPPRRTSSDRSSRGARRATPTAMARLRGRRSRAPDGVSPSAPRRRRAAMNALVRMRLAAFLRSGQTAPAADRRPGRAVASSTAAASPGRGGLRRTPPPCSSRCWRGRPKLLLDVEPDVQRRLARCGRRGPRGLAGLLAAAVLAGSPVLRCVAMLAPWLFGARDRDRQLWLSCALPRRRRSALGGLGTPARVLLAGLRWPSGRARRGRAVPATAAAARPERPVPSAGAGAGDRARRSSDASPARMALAPGPAA